MRAAWASRRSGVVAVMLLVLHVSGVAIRIWLFTRVPGLREEFPPRGARPRRVTRGGTR